MASLSQIFEVPPLDSSLGAVLLGVIVGSMLYGLTVHQTYRYFKLYPEDRLFLKSLVLTILAFETVHTAVWIVVIYHFAITDAFNLAKILRGHWSVRIMFLITGIVVFICQGFYARRVFLLGRRYWWLVIPAVVTMFGGLGFAVAAGIEDFLAGPLLSDLQHISWLVSIAYGFAVVTDVILTGALVFVLHKFRIAEGSERSRSDPVLDTLIVYTVNTGLLTSVISVIAFVFALIIPGNLIYAAVSIVGAKLYANSVLALLNSRRSIDNQFLDDFSPSIGVGGRAKGLPSVHLRPRGGMDCESMVFNTPQPYSFTSETSTMQNQVLTSAQASEGVAGTGM